MTDIEQAMEQIAQKARAKADEMEDRAGRMRELIANADFLRQRAEAYLERRAQRHWWELDEVFPDDEKPTIWVGSALEFVTGQGMTKHLLATLARSEAEFRRAFARRTNRELANAAALDEIMQAFLDRTWSEPPRPAALSLYICHHENYA